MEASYPVDRVTRFAGVTGSDLNYRVLRTLRESSREILTYNFVTCNMALSS